MLDARVACKKDRFIRSSLGLFAETAEVVREDESGVG